LSIVAAATQLYGHHCSHCHGFNMVNPGTVAYDLRQFPHNDKARFVHSVTQGKNGRMPQWGDLLKPEEIDEIWAYVKTGGAQRKPSCACSRLCLCSFQACRSARKVTVKPRRSASV
jgi:mono/diheme cytochrome c family protein